MDESSEAIHDIKFVAVDVVNMQVDGRTVATTTIGGAEIDRSVLTEQTQASLIDAGIEYETSYRVDQKSKNSGEFAFVSVATAAGALCLGVEAYRSTSNWARAAYSAGALVTTIMTAGGIGVTVDLIRNRAPETRIPTERIQALESLKKSLGQSSEQAKAQ